MIPGVCIVAGIYAIALTIMILFKEKIFLNPIIGALSKIIFSDKEPNKQSEQQNIQP
jgi:hypothetical protein